jgi:hypothetical protein
MNFLSRSAGVVFAILLALSASIPAASAVAGGSAGERGDAAQERYEAAKAAFESAKANYNSGMGMIEDIHLWSARWATANRFFGTAGATAGFRDHLKRMVDMEAVVKARVDAGTAAPWEKQAARYYCAEAEMWVARGSID